MCITEVPTMNKQIFDKSSFLITSLKKHTIKIYPFNLKPKVKKGINKKPSDLLKKSLWR